MLPTVTGPDGQQHTCCDVGDWEEITSWIGEGTGYPSRLYPNLIATTRAQPTFDWAIGAARQHTKRALRRGLPSVQVRSDLINELMGRLSSFYVLSG